MIIGISSTGNSMQSALDMRFGRCSFFAIYDTDTKTAKFVENAAVSASGGAGTAASQVMIDNDAEIIITGNMGPNAYGVFSGSDIKVYRCASISLENAIQLFLDSKLEPISNAGPAHAGMNR